MAKTKLFSNYYFIEMILAYYFLTDYSGLGREFRLVENMLFLNFNNIYEYSFNLISIF